MGRRGRRTGQNQLWLAQWLTIHGRLAEAVAQAQRAVRLDPSSPGALANLAAALYFSGRYQDAIQAADKAIGLHPRFQPAYKWRYRAQLLLGDDYKAIMSRAMETASWAQFSEERLLALMHEFEGLYRAGGRAAVASHFIAGVSAGIALGAHRYEQAVWKTWIGDRAGALDELEAAVKSRPYDIMYVAVDPVFAPLRSDPRFREIVRAVGLSPN